MGATEAWGRSMLFFWLLGHPNHFSFFLKLYLSYSSQLLIYVDVCFPFWPLQCGREFNTKLPSLYKKGPYFSPSLSVSLPLLSLSSSIVQMQRMVELQNGRAQLSSWMAVQKIIFSTATSKYWLSIKYTSFILN